MGCGQASHENGGDADRSDADDHIFPPYSTQIFNNAGC